jgi:ABC-type multidrug transport system permease subunit
MCITAPTVEVLGLMQQVMLSATSLVAGLFVPSPILPSGWLWLKRIVPSSYALEALMNAVFHCTGATCDTVPVPRGASFVRIPVYAYLQNRYGLGYETRWTGIGWIFLIAVVLAILTTCALYITVLWNRRRVRFQAWAASTLADEDAPDAIQRGSSSLTSKDVENIMHDAPRRQPSQQSIGQS